MEKEGLDAAKRATAEKAATPPVDPNAKTKKEPSSHPEAIRARQRRAADKAEKDAKAARQAKRAKQQAVEGAQLIVTTPAAEAEEPAYQDPDSDGEHYVDSKGRKRKLKAVKTVVHNGMVTTSSGDKRVWTDTERAAETPMSEPPC